VTTPAVANEYLFMVGCARTGSTLLQHVLNRSPDICLAPETHFMKRARVLGLASRLDAADTPAKRRALVDRLYQVDRQSTRGGWAWLRRNVPVETFADRLERTDRSERAVFDLFIRLYAEWIKPGETPRLLGEKTPGHIRHVPRLLEWYPNARILQTFRDPRAIYVSELQRRRQGRWGVKARLPQAASGLIDPMLAPMQLAHTAVRWKQAARFDRQFQRELGDRYLTVRFEDLVAQPEEQLRRVTAFVGIPYDADMLDIRVTGSSYSAGRHAGTGFNPEIAERWRAHVGPGARAWFRGTLGRQAAEHGYRL